MFPKTQVTDAVRATLPALDIAFEATIDPVYRKSVREHQQEIEALGGHIEYGHFLAISFNHAPGETQFTAASFLTFTKVLTTIVPHEAFEAAHLYFKESIDPPASLVESFEHHRRRQGNPDFRIDKEGTILERNDEPIRALIKKLPNELALAYFYNRNGHSEQTGKCYDLIGQCNWLKQNSRSHSGITDVHFSQMVRSIGLLREHALASMVMPGGQDQLR